MAVGALGLISPFFFEGTEGDTVTVTAKRYVEVLERFWTELRRLPGIKMKKQWLMQDGAPPHTANISLRWLRAHFEGRVIGKKTDNH